MFTCTVGTRMTRMLIIGSLIAAPLLLVHSLSQAEQPHLLYEEHDPYFTTMFERIAAANDAGDTQSVQVFLEQMESEGTADAFYTLGDLYQNDYGIVDTDQDRAFRYYSLAADLGSDAARVQIIFMTMRGEGTEPDVEGAFDQLVARAESGNVTSMDNLGYLYLLGTEMPRDCDEALKWMTMAAEHGSITAYDRLGSIYANGTCVGKDAGRASYWFGKAAEGGHVMAMKKLAGMLMEGVGAPQDKVNGYKWLILSWDQHPGPVPEPNPGLMTAEEISTAHALAAKWRAAHPDHKIDYPKE